jgi:hypothetical protein
MSCKYLRSDSFINVKVLDPDPHIDYMDPQHWAKVFIMIEW